MIFFIALVAQYEKAETSDLKSTIQFAVKAANDNVDSGDLVPKLFVYGGYLLLALPTDPPTIETIERLRVVFKAAKLFSKYFS